MGYTPSARPLGRPRSVRPRPIRTRAGVRRHRFAYYPFGGGGRVCIGAVLAAAEAQVTLAVLGRRFSFALASGEHVEPDASFTLRPKQAIMMNVNER